MGLTSAGNMFGQKPRRVDVITAMVLANRNRAVPAADREETRHLALVELQRELDGVPGIGSTAADDQAATMHRERAAKGRTVSR